MQGVEKSDTMLLVIAATNCPWALDGALLRPGRFNEKIHIPLPDKNARLFILNKGLKTCKLEQGIDIKAIAERLDGCNGADIVEFCEKVKMLLIRKEIAKESNLVITQADIDEILSTTKTSVLPRDIESMNKFLKSK
jgi:transitional endoplasmic reticulum ATPase